MTDRSSVVMDPLSDLIRVAELRAVVTGELRASGAWALRMPAPQGLKFFAIARGHAWMQLEGGDTVRLEQGDVVVMNWSRTFLLASDLSAIEQDARVLFGAQAANRRVAVVLAEGTDFHQIGGHVLMGSDSDFALTKMLPQLVHLRSTTPEASVLRWLVEQLVRERSSTISGHELMAEQLAQMLFLQSLRIHLARDETLPPSWLRVMTDERLQPALRLMHEEPGRSWRLDELARASAMSRTSFATRFKAQSGLAPLTYLTQWRMQLARHALRQDPRPFGAWVSDLGYASESAFSHAFKRATGLSPAQYRRNGLTTHEGSSGTS